MLYTYDETDSNSAREKRGKRKQKHHRNASDQGSRSRSETPSQHATTTTTTNGTSGTATTTLNSLPNELLWQIYLYLTGPFLSKLALLNKSHYNLIHYSNHYPTQHHSDAHAFWMYLVQCHYESQLRRRLLFPCEIHPKVLYLFQWAKENETRIMLLNRACMQLESRFRLELRDKVADVCLFVPQLFWFMRLSYKFETYFQKRDMTEHALYGYYGSGAAEEASRSGDAEQTHDVPRGTVHNYKKDSPPNTRSRSGSNSVSVQLHHRELDASLKYYERQGDYLNFNVASPTLLIVPKRVPPEQQSSTKSQGNDPQELISGLISTSDPFLAKSKLNAIAQSWMQDWGNSQFIVQYEVNSILEVVLRKKVRPKLLLGTTFSELNGMRKANGLLDRVKIYVEHAQQRLH